VIVGERIQAVCSVSKAPGPRSIAGGISAGRPRRSSPCSVPAARMPLTVALDGAQPVDGIHGREFGDDGAVIAEFESDLIRMLIYTQDPAVSDVGLRHAC
jgi:hypothetical protein